MGVRALEPNDASPHHGGPGHALKYAPMMSALQAVLDAEADAELDINRTTAGTLAERLDVFTSGSLAGGLLSGQTNGSLDSRLVVFSIGGAAGPPVAVAMYELDSG